MDEAGTISQTRGPVHIPIRMNIEDRTSVLRRLTVDWKAAWSELGLSNATTITDVSKRLDIDRGTAQRLNRLAKWPDTSTANISQFPGVRAWQRVLAGVKSILGSEHPNYQTLSIACDDFGKWLGEMGGSRSSAMRQIEAGDGAPDPRIPRSKSAQVQIQDARATWVEAVIESFGYSVDVRLALQMERENKTSSPSRMDLALIHVLKGCRGNLSALPISFSRAGYTGDRTEIQSSKDGNARSFHVLSSATSKPAPVLVTTLDSQHQTIFVEPNWTSMPQPLDLAILHEERQAILSPSAQQKYFEAATVNRHPNRRLVIERFVSRDIDSKFTATLRAFRTQMVLTNQEPWFDRIPESTTVQRVGTIDEARQQGVFPGYSATLSEAMALLNWDWDDMIVYRAEIINPMPLATYTIKFESNHA
jgi:hypothetical protein